MDKLKELIKNNPIIAMFVPFLVSSSSFIGNLAVALSDGALDSNEIHKLFSSANGFEVIVLIIIIVALKKDTK